MQQDFLGKLDRLLTTEELFVDGLKNSRAAARLSTERKRLLEHLRALVQSDELPLMVEAEKKIIAGDLSRYANSAAMSSSLKAALQAMRVIAHHLTLIDDKEKYRIVDQSHSLAKNRKAGLPFDEARQALASHYTRLTNMDKSRLDEDDKHLIDVRKAVIARAIECYTQRQTQILEIEPVTRTSQD